MSAAIPPDARADDADDDARDAYSRKGHGSEMNLADLDHLLGGEAGETDGAAGGGEADPPRPGSTVLDGNYADRLLGITPAPGTAPLPPPAPADHSDHDDFDSDVPPEPAGGPAAGADDGHDDFEFDSHDPPEPPPRPAEPAAGVRKAPPAPPAAGSAPSATPQYIVVQQIVQGPPGGYGSAAGYAPPPPSGGYDTLDDGTGDEGGDDPPAHASTVVFEEPALPPAPKGDEAKAKPAPKPSTGSGSGDTRSAAVDLLRNSAASRVRAGLEAADPKAKKARLKAEKAARRARGPKASKASNTSKPAKESAGGDSPLANPLVLGGLALAALLGAGYYFLPSLGFGGGADPTEYLVRSRELWNEHKALVAADTPAAQFEPMQAKMQALKDELTAATKGADPLDPRRAALSLATRMEKAASFRVMDRDAEETEKSAQQVLDSQLKRYEVK